MANFLVLVTVDCLRFDATTYQRGWTTATPTLNLLDAVRFKNAIAQAPFTAGSFPSIISSQYSSQCRGFSLPESVPTIAEAMNEAGYDTACFVFNPALRPARGYDDGFRRFEDFVSNGDDSSADDGGRGGLDLKRVLDVVRPRFKSVLDQDTHLYRTLTRAYRLLEFKFDYSQVRAGAMTDEVRSYVENTDEFCL